MAGARFWNLGQGVSSKTRQANAASHAVALRVRGLHNGCCAAARRRGVPRVLLAHRRAATAAPRGRRCDARTCVRALRSVFARSRSRVRCARLRARNARAATQLSQVSGCAPAPHARRSATPRLRAGPADSRHGRWCPPRAAFIQPPPPTDPHCGRVGVPGAGKVSQSLPRAALGRGVSLGCPTGPQGVQRVRPVTGGEVVTGGDQLSTA